MATGLGRHSQDGQLRFTVRRDFYSDRVAHICAMGFDATAACAMLRECGSVDEAVHRLLEASTASAVSDASAVSVVAPGRTAATQAATVHAGASGGMITGDTASAVTTTLVAAVSPAVTHAPAYLSTCATGAPPSARQLQEMGFSSLQAEDALAQGFRTFPEVVQYLMEGDIAADGDLDAYPPQFFEDAAAAAWRSFRVSCGAILPAVQQPPVPEEQQQSAAEGQLQDAQPRRGCRGGKHVRLKEARKAFCAAKASGEAVWRTAAQADLSARASACRAGPSGAGRRLHGGGTGRRPRAPCQQTAAARRKKYKRRQRKILEHNLAQLKKMQERNQQRQQQQRQQQQRYRPQH